MKKSLSVFATAVTCAAVLSACLVPERFSAKVEVEPDASYTFRYTGTAIHALAVAQLKQTGSLSEKDQNGLMAEADKLSKSPDVRRATYKGNGRYELEIESKKKTGQPLHILNI